MGQGADRYTEKRTSNGASGQENAAPCEVHFPTASGPARFLAIHEHEVIHAGGKVKEGRFVTVPGVIHLAETRTTAEGAPFLKAMHINHTLSDAHQISEFDIRQTYQSYPETSSANSRILERVIRQAQHRSTVAGVMISHVFSGVSLPGTIEIVKHGARIARLTSSKTAAMDETLYRVSSPESDRSPEIDAIKSFLELRESVRAIYQPLEMSENGREFFNLFNLTLKCLSFHHISNAKDLHSFFKVVATQTRATEEEYILCDRAATNLALRGYEPLIEPWHFYSQLPRSSNHKAIPQTSIQSVESKNGEVHDGLFVVRPGCRLTLPSEDTLKTLADTEPDFLRKFPFKFQLSGLAYETVLELVAHREAEVLYSKLSDSEQPLYRIQGKEEEKVWQKEAIRWFLNLRARIPQLPGSFELCTRAVDVEFTMTLGDFHKLFIGRLSHQGNEQEIQELCSLMCRKLHSIVPEIILEPAAYYSMENGMKY
jgi:hypothetical protein